jgi:hypothetical protein
LPSLRVLEGCGVWLASSITGDNRHRRLASLFSLIFLSIRVFLTASHTLDTLKAYWLFFAQSIFDCLRDASNSGNIASGIAKRERLGWSLCRTSDTKSL